MAPTKVLIYKPCPLGVPEMVPKAHIKRAERAWTLGDDCSVRRGRAMLRMVVLVG